MTKPTAAEIRDRFAHHPPKGNAVQLHELIRAQFGDLAQFLNDSLPDSREAAHAQRALQEAAMWSNAAVAIHVSGVLEKVCPNCREPGKHWEGISGLIGSGHYTCIRKTDPDWENNLRKERAQSMNRQHPTEHLVVLDETGWTIMHSVKCREDGDLVGCVFTRAASKTNFTGWPSPVYVRLEGAGNDLRLAHMSVP